MSAETLYARPRKFNISKTRCHDYLYDSSFIVCSARDYARTAFKAAMASAQVILQPIHSNMFSEVIRKPRVQVVYHMNCRLPEHIDRSYDAYQDRAADARNLPEPQLLGRDRYQFAGIPKKVVLALKSTSPDFRPPQPSPVTVPTKPRNRGTQSLYRESSAQTIPWQPDGRPGDGQTTPEVMLLDKLEWGPGKPYRLGDLPADFHTTEIINKMRHARMWMELAEKGAFQRFMKKRDEIITDVETKDWIFREAEIDELQNIRLELLHRIQKKQREKQNSRTSLKLAKLWSQKKHEMAHKIDHIRRHRDREHRKLVALHEGGGRVGLVARLRAARGHEEVCKAASDPTSDLHAPLLRNGYQARRRHAEICYDPSLLSAEDHLAIGEPPAWLVHCLDLTKSCSGHHLPQDNTKLCERETKWSEQFLENLHMDLMKARLGAATMSAGPLHVLKPKRSLLLPRPPTPVVDAVDDAEETTHQTALLLQKLVRGRAVQSLMYEGRTRAAELTEELKTTHGLQKEDKLRIAREEAKAREFNARKTETEQKEEAITALVDELCGGAVSAALDFLEKELRRLKEERRQHAFILIALRDKRLREAAEGGRRQKEEHRRREHDEMFKQVLGVTQGTVEAYLKQIITEGVELAAEEDAVKAAKAHADKLDQSMLENCSLSTAEQNELVAELVQQFLLPHAHKTAARHRISEQQNAQLANVRKTIFGLVDDAEIKEEICERCSRSLGGECHCQVCPGTVAPVATTARMDYRWQYTKTTWEAPEKTTEERFPMSYEARRLLDAIVDDVVQEGRAHKADKCEARRYISNLVNQRCQSAIQARDVANEMVDVALGVKEYPVRPDTSYSYVMFRTYPDAIERDAPYGEGQCPKDLPSEIRRRAAEELGDTTCYCKDEDTRGVKFTLESLPPDDRMKILPSEIRELEELKRCKCDVSTEESEEGMLSPEPAPFTEETRKRRIMIDGDWTSLKSDPHLTTAEHTAEHSPTEQQSPKSDKTD